MDYEKAYKDALNRAKNLKEMYPQDAAGYEEVFPELKESEDERIAEELIKALRSISTGLQYAIFLTEEKKQRWLAWLEKQKEQSTGHKTYDGKALSRSYDLGYRKGVADAEKEMYDESGYTPDESRAYDHGYENGYNDGKDEVKQKSAEWSEEEKDKLNSIERLIVNANAHGNYLIGDKEAIDLQHFIRSIVKPTTNLAEWSGEDEKMKERLITRLNWITYNTRTDGTSPNITFFDEINWLKSLRPSWKPSEEQMEAFEDVLEAINTKTNLGRLHLYQQGALGRLYQDLKKL